MVIGVLKTLTWGTVAAAVVSAVLLAFAGTGLPRIGALVGDSVRGRPAAAAQQGLPGRLNAPSDAAPHSAAAGREGASR